MPRRLNGGLDVRGRPNGGALVIMMSATGEAFEIERSPAQMDALVEKIQAIPRPVVEEKAEEAPQPASAADEPQPAPADAPAPSEPEPAA